MDRKRANQRSLEQASMRFGKTTSEVAFGSNAEESFLAEENVKQIYAEYHISHQYNLEFLGPFDQVTSLWVNTVC